MGRTRPGAAGPARGARHRRGPGPGHCSGGGRSKAQGVPADRFGAGLAALAAFVEREGPAKLPRSHGTSLGTWLNNQKAHRDKLSPEQIGQLEALGVAW
ncbi:helicase associated domain-containing protein [Kitasatospora sp. NPDC001175]|uniref:helicase associated domain-containing protein n=1 Tax=Kitasatospora sp. NPDC001175 TaxID=3157103 RepID=UPI003CFCD0E1